MRDVLLETMDFDLLLEYHTLYNCYGHISYVGERHQSLVGSRTRTTIDWTIRSICDTRTVSMIFFSSPGNDNEL
jgi:hypothetical protein